MQNTIPQHTPQTSTYSAAEANIHERILHVMMRLQKRSHPPKASTKDIANAIYLSHAQTGRYLRELEADSKIIRIGQKAGWRVAPHHTR